MTIIRKCINCGNEFEIVCSIDGYFDWRHHKKTLNEAMPNLTISEKRMLSINICENCAERLGLKGKMRYV